jgi:hypothetical protein
MLGQHLTRAARIQATVILGALERGRAHLGFPLLILLVLGGTLTLAASHDAPAPASSEETAAAVQLDPDELARISVDSLPRVARGVERVRELRFDELPEPEVVSSEFLNRLGARELERRHGNLGIGADQAVGEITGLIESDEDLGAAYTSTGDLAAAAYDTRTKRLYVVSDAVAANQALVEFVLAHELDHALEDQHYAIGGGGRLDDDAALARQALVEGLATDVMIEFAALNLNPLELLAAAETIDEGTGEVPKAYVDLLTWTYLGGRKFIASLRDYAGSWKLVDYALESRPPTTTEQVLHPRKYVLDERPGDVRIDAAELRERGWTLADRSVFGELATDYLLRVGAEPEEARDAAAGWDGDRYELWRRDVAPGGCEYPCRSDLVLVAKWVWDTPGDAVEFERAATTYLTEGVGGDAVAEDVWQVEGGYVAVASSAHETGLVFAPQAELARSAAVAQRAK